MKQIRLLTLCLVVMLALTACGTGSTPAPIQTETEIETEKTERTYATIPPQDLAKAMAIVTEERMRMLQASTQIALGRYGFADNTSSRLSDWTFASNTLNATNFWITTTQDPLLGRVKTIFVWSGRDSDDLLLAYLLVGGNDIYDQLQAAKDKAWDD